MKLTDFNGHYLVCGPVHSRASGEFVFPVERELGNCRSAEEGEDGCDEGGQQHVGEWRIQCMFQLPGQLISTLVSVSTAGDPTMVIAFTTGEV